MKPSAVFLACAALLAGHAPQVIASAAPAAGDPTEIVVLTSQFRDAELSSVPFGVTVLDESTIEETAVQHFEELVKRIPNLNWSGEGSRSRYLQIRGTGELEQYEGAPNPSVGFIVDDIDVSDIGGVATTFDVARVEVLRGPQGTRYGSNALAGLVYVQSAEPGASPEAWVESTLAGDDTWALGAAAGGPVAGFGEVLTWRVALQQYSSDGFRHNEFLGRRDTSDRDETTARAKLRWQPSDDLRVQLTAFHVDLDNGYDDFSIFNGFDTQSDEPGRDAQETDAAALRATIGLGNRAELTSITGIARSDIEYGFDADWGNPGFWSPAVYAFVQSFDRTRDTLNQELRLASRPAGRIFGADWVTGLYVLTLDEANVRHDRGVYCETACDDLPFEADAASDYESTNLAWYGELSIPVGADSTVSAGIRWEQRTAEYSDSSGHRFDPRDRMLGGDVSFSHRLSDDINAWVRAARGFKGGGFNPSLAGIDFAEFPDFNLDDGDIEFDPEYLWSYEAGLRWQPSGKPWNAAVTAFFQDRDELQVKVPMQLRLGDPTTFLFVTDNAESATTQGLEIEASWSPVAPLVLGAALGLLDTEIDRFSARPEIEGRALAHAPRRTLSLDASWRTASGWFARVDYATRGRFYIDYCQAADCNDPRTGDNSVVDLRAGRQWSGWTVEAWCRNLFDDHYAVRGFYFANEPPAFEQKLYTRLGDPRQAGVTVRFNW